MKTKYIVVRIQTIDTNIDSCDYLIKGYADKKYWKGYKACLEDIKKGQYK